MADFGNRTFGTAAGHEPGDAGSPSDSGAYDLTLFDVPLVPRLEGADRLYCKVEDDGRTLDFGTFFGAIPVARLKTYTNITSLTFFFDITGAFDVVMHLGETVILTETIFQSKAIQIDLSTVPDAAMLLLYPVLRAKTRDSRLNRLTVSVNSRSVSKVDCALITCTYKREAQVKKNIRYLTEHIKAVPDLDFRVIVVDNGRTLEQGDLAEEVVLVPNVNNGGSGGYKKGMETACEMGGFTHFLLMDDDVEIDFTAVERAVTFLKCLKPEYRDISIAGSMLYLDKPTYQFEAGGHFYEDGSQQGFGHFLDLAAEKALIENQKENDINYGGWWFMLMPGRYAQEGTFPLPFFMKYDDVEYALRCGQRIITLNGVGVWHEKFEAKYNSAAEYYNTRNYLYLCSLHCKDFTDKKALEYARKQMRAKRRRQQYKMAEAVKRGYADYRKGIRWLETLDQEANHREVCRLNYEYLTYDEIWKRYGVRPQEDTFYACPGKRRLIFTLIPKRFAFTDHFYDSPVQYLFAGYAVHCDADRNLGYVTKRRKWGSRLMNIEF